MSSSEHEEEVKKSASEAVALCHAGKMVEGLQALYELSKPDGDEPFVIAAEGVLDVIMKGCLSNVADARKFATIALLNLSNSDDCQVPMCNTPGMVTTCLDVWFASSDDKEKERVLGALSNFAVPDENVPFLLKAPRIIEAAFDGSKPNMPDGIRESALLLLNSMSVLEPAAQAVARDPKFVSLIASCTRMEHTTCHRMATATLLNVSSFPSCRGQVDTPEVIKALTERLQKQDNDKDATKRAAMALANLVGTDASRSHMLTSDESVLFGVQNVLGAAIRTEGRDWRLPAPLQPLRALMLVESNRKYYVAHGLPAMLTDALGVALKLKDPRSAEFAVASIQQLCFDEPVLATIRKDAGLKKHLEALLAYQPSADENVAQWDTAKRAAQYLDFKLSGKLDVVTESPTHAAAASAKAASTIVTSNAANETAPLIMISYSWNNKDVGVAVDEFLSNKGMRVWRDERNMSGDIVTAMMQAVTGCDVFLCVLSKAYHESANCRAEFEFAKNHKKRIVPIMADPGFRLMDSWLGFLLGNVLYYDVMPMASKFDKSMGALIDKELLQKAYLSAGPAPAAAAAAASSSAPIAHDHHEMEKALDNHARLPNSEAELVEWLKSQELLTVKDALVENGFVEAKALADLRKLGVRDIAEALGLSTLNATRLKSHLLDLV